jgi:hypothetical protein
MSTDPVHAVSSEGSSAPALVPIVLSPTTARALPEQAEHRGIGAWLWRFVVRFGAAYATLFLAGRVVSLIPGLESVGGLYARYSRVVVLWAAKQVFQIDRTVPVAMTGSGDKLFDWLYVATTLGVALIVALVWVWFDRARRADRWLNELVRIALRYSLAATMLSYGISKVLREQMPEPAMYRLLQPYGESSPMGLLWTFMGQSWAYSAFAGGMEMLGGFLLFFRRTTTLGALVIIAVMTNVLMMNLAFDVPVKLYSAHYLAFAMVLAVPDLRRLANVLLLHRPTVPASLVRAWPAGRAAKLLIVVKALMVIWVLWLIPTQRIWRFVDAPPRVKPTYYGIYEVEVFSRNGVELPPLTTDAYRWRRVAFDYQNRMSVLLMNDARMMYRFRTSAGGAQIIIEPAFNARAGSRETLAVSLTENGRVRLEGRFFGSELSMQLRLVDERKMLLRDRGFHWISEAPFNR